MLKTLIWNKHTRNLTLWFFFHLLPIKRKRMMFVSWGGKTYSCNPRFIAEALIEDEECKDYDLNFAFFCPDKIEDAPSRINKLEIGSLQYFYKLATSRVIITNIVFSGIYFPQKRDGQLFIQTRHGRGIKKVDFDDAEHLSESYLKASAKDSERADLMLSECILRTKVIRSAFRYDGEVLEKGVPRNKIFFLSEKEKQKIKNKICDTLAISNAIKYLVYAPTFRGNGRRDVYGFNEKEVINCLKERFGGEWGILVSSHPNMRSFYRDIYNFENHSVIDVGLYKDFQEILLLADVLVTDYSSAAFDFALQKKPIFSLVKDADSYDRGLYFNPKELPFPYAENDEQLCENIINFDSEKYLQKLNKFESEVMGLCETGHAAEAVVEWIKQHV